MLRYSVIEWKSTAQLYIAVVQSVERFEPGTLREVKRTRGESWLVGRLKGVGRDDLYALGFRKAEMEFDEAHERARLALDRVNALRSQGKDFLK